MDRASDAPQHVAANPVVLLTIVELTPNNVRCLALRKHEDPVEVARDFGEAHGLAVVVVNALAAHLVQQAHQVEHGAHTVAASGKHSTRPWSPKAPSSAAPSKACSSRQCQSPASPAQPTDAQTPCDLGSQPDTFVRLYNLAATCTAKMAARRQNDLAAFLSQTVHHRAYHSRVRAEVRESCRHAAGGGCGPYPDCTSRLHSRTATPPGTVLETSQRHKAAHEKRLRLYPPPGLNAECTFHPQINVHSDQIVATLRQAQLRELACSPSEQSSCHAEMQNSGLAPGQASHARDARWAADRNGPSDLRPFLDQPADKVTHASSCRHQQPGKKQMAEETMGPRNPVRATHSGASHRRCSSFQVADTVYSESRSSAAGRSVPSQQRAETVARVTEALHELMDRKFTTLFHKLASKKHGLVDLCRVLPGISLWDPQVHIDPEVWTDMEAACLLQAHAHCYLPVALSPSMLNDASARFTALTRLAPVVRTNAAARCCLEVSQKDFVALLRMVQAFLHVWREYLVTTDDSSLVHEVLDTKGDDPA